jgi:hypothetical protein
VTIRTNGAAPPDEPVDESDEEFAERIYLALMAVARGSSSKLRDQLGACVILGRPWASAGDAVREVVREFIAEAEL